MSEGKRIARERATIKAMIRLYCREQHGGGPELCAQCQELLAYAMLRLTHCKFGENKPTCGKCPVHCYKPDMRERVRNVMKFSGPRMMSRHPIIAIRHLIDGLKKV